MPSVIDQTSPAAAVKRRPPGFLLTPFGWAAESIAAMMHAEPALFADLFAISRPRMHAMALALAHVDGEASPEFCLFLARSSLPDILDRVLGHRPTGIRRALAHLPYAVLSRESYWQLVQLLADPETAYLLHHIGEIDDSTIRLLYEVPARLRRVVMITMEGLSLRLDGFADGLRFLVFRGAAANLEAMVADLATASQPDQFIAKMKGLVEALPLPEGLPPAQVRKGRRLDRTAEIFMLAKHWSNCLATYARPMNDGGCAVYLWEDTTAPAACLIQRYGRFGWFVEEVKGPKNADLKPDQLAAIHSAFAEVNVPRTSVIHPLQSILESEGMRPTRRNRGRARNRQQQQVEEDAWRGCE